MNELEVFVNVSADIKHNVAAYCTVINGYSGEFRIGIRVDGVDQGWSTGYFPSLYSSGSSINSGNYSV